MNNNGLCFPKVFLKQSPGHSFHTCAAKTSSARHEDDVSLWDFYNPPEFKSSLGTIKEIFSDKQNKCALPGHT